MDRLAETVTLRADLTALLADASVNAVKVPFTAFNPDPPLIVVDMP